MKKLILGISLLLLAMCLFTFAISAEEKTVSSASELETAISDFNTNGGKITLNIGGDITGLSGNVTISGEGTLIFNLTANTTVDKKIYVSGKVNLTINLNEYMFETKNVSATGSAGCAIEVANSNAVFYMHNGTFKSSDVGAWTRAGSFTFENLTMIGAEEAVYSDARTDYQQVTARNSTLCGVDLFDVAEGALIENCIITADTSNRWYGISIDCWSAKDGVMHPFVIKNTKTADGRTLTFSAVGGFQDIYIYDSDYVVGTLGTDSGGPAHLEKITSSTCVEQGQRVVYEGSSTPISTEALPLLDHSIEVFIGVEWDNFFENGFNTGLCAVCEAQAREQEPSASPLFESKGLSYAEYVDTTKSMTQGFKVNKDMLVYLEAGYDFGVIATVNKDGNEIAPALSGDGVVSASFTKSNYSIFHVKVTNIPEANKETKIVFCAYLVNSGKTYYLNNGTTAEAVVGLDYKTVSE